MYRAHQQGKAKSVLQAIMLVATRGQTCAIYSVPRFIVFGHLKLSHVGTHQQEKGKSLLSAIVLVDTRRPCRKTGRAGFEPPYWSVLNIRPEGKELGDRGQLNKA